MPMMRDDVDDWVNTAVVIDVVVSTTVPDNIVVELASSVDVDVTIIVDGDWILVEEIIDEGWVLIEEIIDDGWVLIEEIVNDDWMLIEEIVDKGWILVEVIAEENVEIDEEGIASDVLDERKAEVIDENW